MSGSSVYRPVVDVVGELVERASKRLQKRYGFEVFYQYGHITDIFAILSSYSQTEAFAKRKYPAVFLIQNFAEHIPADGDVQCEADVNLVIVAPSVQGYRPEQRYGKVFIPTLYPIYTELMAAIGKSGDLLSVPAYGVPHEKIDAPRGSEFLSVHAGKSTFNDHLDAIWLKGMRLKITRPLC